MFYSLSNRPPKVVSVNNLPSMTIQAAKDECDINRIVARYRQTGSYYEPGVSPTRKPQFGDYSAIPDYREALSIIHQADDDFSALPSKVRRRFNNDPLEYVAFLQDASNRDEAISLGLVVEQLPLDVTVPTDTKPTSSGSGV